MSERAKLSGPLPAAVRAKVIELAAASLPLVPAPGVPPVLRRFATFAPAKRARLAGPRLVSAVEQDEAFRGRLAEVVRGLAPELVAALEADTPLGENVLVEAAAVAYLVRPNGWVDVVEKSRALQEAGNSGGGDAAQMIDKLTAELAAARTKIKAGQEKAKTQLAGLKSDNVKLRKTLGQTRAALNEAKEESRKASTESAQVRAAGDAVIRDLEAEIRRLRSRVADLESTSTSSRRAARENRDAETTRLRLLLDTLTESAAGLRRELSLPATTVHSTRLPADSVEAVAPAASAGVAGVGRGLAPADPGLLRKLLDLPQTHLIIDGYNVSKEAWPTAPLEQQRTRLISGVARLLAGRRLECTIVFDGADLVSPPVTSSPRGLRVRFSPADASADDLIRRLVGAEPPGRPVVVVSTDREVAEDITRLGGRSVAAVALLGVLGVKPA